MPGSLRACLLFCGCHGVFWETRAREITALANDLHADRVFVSHWKSGRVTRHNTTSHVTSAEPEVRDEPMLRLLGIVLLLYSRSRQDPHWPITMFFFCLLNTRQWNSSCCPSPDGLRQVINACVYKTTTYR